MPRRIMKPPAPRPAIRQHVARWLEWEIRKERVLHDGEPTLRGVRLQVLLNAVVDGKDVDIQAEDLHASIAPNRGAEYRLTKNELVEK